MSTEQTAPTPRVDAALVSRDEVGHPRNYKWWVHADFARQLERELTTERANTEAALNSYHAANKERLAERARADALEIECQNHVEHIAPFKLRAEAAEEANRLLREELDWQNHRNAGHPTKGGFEFYINEEWTGLATEAMDANYGWHAALRKHRIDPDDERVRIRRVAEDDAILKELAELKERLSTMRGIIGFFACTIRSGEKWSERHDATLAQLSESKK